MSLNLDKILILGRFSWLRAALLIAVLFAGLGITARANPTITLSWNANGDPGTVGYVVYSGTTSGAYTQAVYVGDVTSSTITNLPSGPAYYFAVASYDSSGMESAPSNEVDVVYGNGAPTLTGGGAVSPSFVVGAAAITGTSVTFGANVNPNGGAGPAGDPANVYVSWQYGVAAGSYTNNTGAQPIGIGSTAIPVRLTLASAGLGAAVFHYQLVISNAFGFTYGPDQTFSLAPPAVVNAAAVKSTTPSLSLTVNPNGIDTIVSIQYGLTTAYSSGTVSLGDIGSGVSPVSLTPTLPGLTPNTPYHYRIVTTNALGTFYGPDEVFTEASYGTSIVFSSLQSAPGVAGASLNKIGNPATNALGHTAFQSTISGPSRVITNNNNSGIWADSGTNGLCLVVRTGAAAPDYTGNSTIGVFSSLSDPVYADDDAVAFLGKLLMSGTVNSENNVGIWSTTSGTLTLVARAGDPAPGPNGLTTSWGPLFGSFQQFVLPDQGGIIFLATMALYTGGVTPANDQGIWAVGSDAVMRRIICKGDTLTVHGVTKTIATLSIFNAPAASVGQTRHFSNSGGLLYKANFTDGTSSVVQSMIQ